MARLEYFLVSQSIAVDQFTNNVSIFDVLEELYVDEFPSVVPQVVALTLWRASDESDANYGSSLRISMPGAETIEFPTTFKIGPQGRRRIVQRIAGLPILRAGEVRFEVLLNGVHAAEHVLTVKQTAPMAPIATEALQRPDAPSPEAPRCPPPIQGGNSA